MCTLQVTQDFIKYIQEQSGGIPEGEGREPPPYLSEEEEEEEETEEGIPYISAEELVRVFLRFSSTQMKRKFRLDVLMLMFCVTAYVADWRVRATLICAAEREQ